MNPTRAQVRLLNLLAESPEPIAVAGVGLSTVRNAILHGWVEVVPTKSQSKLKLTDAGRSLITFPRETQ